MEGKEIKIAICDDSPEAVGELKGKIEKYLKEHDLAAIIHTFLNGEALIRQAAEQDIVFLDIEMPGMNGLEAGKIIHNTNGKCKIIMATAMEGEVKETFKINAFRFLGKPYLDNELEEALDAVWATYIGNQIVELYENRNLFEAAQREIAYFHAYNSNVEAIVGGREMRKEISLSKMEEILDERLFCSISRWYIVNMRFVNSYKDGVVCIVGINNKMEKIKVSRGKKKEFEKRYMEYDLRYRG